MQPWIRVARSTLCALNFAVAMIGCSTDKPSAETQSLPAADKGVDASSAPSTTDGGFVDAPMAADAGPFCTSTLDAYCATPGFSCALDWQTAVQEAPSSQDCAGRSDGVVTTDCGPFEVLGRRGIDTGREDYYDKSSGHLVAVVGSSANCGCSVCLGGPADFVPVTTCSVAMPVCTDVGGEGDGASPEAIAPDSSPGD